MHQAIVGSWLINLFGRFTVSTTLPAPLPPLAALKDRVMKRIVLMFVCMFVLAIATSGCRSAGQGQLLPGGFGQPQAGFQQPGVTLGGVGNNLGQRLGNNLINRGVNAVAGRLLSGL